MAPSSRTWVASLLEALDPAARNLAVQPSLFRGVDLNKPVPRQYDLGMDDFVDSEAFEKWKLLFLKRTRWTAKAATDAAPAEHPCLAAVGNNVDQFDFRQLQ